MKPLTALTGRDFKSNKGYSNRYNENTQFLEPLQQFIPELHWEKTPLNKMIDIALVELFYLKNTTLKQATSYYNFHKEKGYFSKSKLDILLTRCENLEMATNILFALIVNVQKFLPEIEKFENAEKQAKEYWGYLPLKYALVFDYELSEPNPDKKIAVTLYRK